MDGLNISGAINFPNTGSFSTNYMTTTTTIPLQEGEQVLRFTIDQQAYNLDTMTFSFVSPLSTISFTAKDNLQLYPNPFDEQLTLSFKGIENTIKFELLDLNGRVVYEQEHTGARESKLSPSAVQGGLYFLKAIMNTGIEKTVRVVKK